VSEYVVDVQFFVEADDAESAWQKVHENLTRSAGQLSAVHASNAFLLPWGILENAAQINA
jgi:hypothetical protein